MDLTICNYCGSSKLRADRALGGKLICCNCGRTYSKLRSNSKSTKKLNELKLLFLFSITILIIIIIF